MIIVGIFDKFMKKSEEKKEEVPQSKQIDTTASPNLCSACNQPGADKKFGGQYWHKQCLRRARKMAKGMI